jgi:hypothetical protein
MSSHDLRVGELAIARRPDTPRRVFELNTAVEMSARHWQTLADGHGTYCRNKSGTSERRNVSGPEKAARRKLQPGNGVGTVRR